MNYEVNKQTTIDYLLAACFGLADNTTIEKVDIDYLILQASRHKVLPLVALFAKKNNHFSESSYFYSQSELFISALMYHKRRNMLLHSEAKRISENFKRVGIKHAFRKGVAFSLILYPEPGSRSMMDIDILILPENREKVVNSLKNLNYGFDEIDIFTLKHSSLSRREEIFWKRYTHSLPPFFREGCDDSEVPVFIVDVTDSFGLPASGSVSSRLLLSNVQQNFEIPTLTPYLNLLDVCLHTFKESTTLRYIHRLKHQRLIQYVDFHRLLSKIEDVFRFLYLSEHLEVQRQVAWVFYHYYQLVGVQNPAVMKWIEKSVDEKFLNKVGAVDGYDSLAWQVGFFERMFSNDLVVDFPTSKSTI